MKIAFIYSIQTSALQSLTLCDEQDISVVLNYIKYFISYVVAVEISTAIAHNQMFYLLVGSFNP